MSDEIRNARAALDAYATAGYYLDSEVRQIARILHGVVIRPSGGGPIITYEHLSKRLVEAADRFREAHLTIERARFGTHGRSLEASAWEAGQVPDGPPAGVEAPPPNVPTFALYLEGCDCPSCAAVRKGVKR